jgi:hypothetical protein
LPTVSFITVANGKFDGFAVKNEKYSRYWDDSQIQSYLDKLNEVHTDATAAGLSTHYSVFWHWGRRTGGTQPERIVEWKGLSANVTEHMVRIFDSVDIQVRILFWHFTRRGGQGWDYP